MNRDLHRKLRRFDCVDEKVHTYQGEGKVLYIQVGRYT